MRQGAPPPYSPVQPPHAPAPASRRPAPPLPVLPPGPGPAALGGAAAVQAFAVSQARRPHHQLRGLPPRWRPGGRVAHQPTRAVVRGRDGRRGAAAAGRGRARVQVPPVRAREGAGRREGGGGWRRIAGGAGSRGLSAAGRRRQGAPRRCPRYSPLPSPALPPHTPLPQSYLHPPSRTPPPCRDRWNTIYYSELGSRWDPEPGLPWLAAGKRPSPGDRGASCRGRSHAAARRGRVLHGGPRPFGRGPLVTDVTRSHRRDSSLM